MITGRRKLRNIESNDLFAHWADVREVSEGEMGGIRSMQSTVSHYVISLQYKQTNCTVRHNTLMPYSNVLHDSVHQNHHRAPLLQKLK